MRSMWTAASDMDYYDDPVSVSEPRHVRSLRGKPLSLPITNRDPGDEDDRGWHEASGFDSRDYRQRTLDVAWDRSR